MGRAPCCDKVGLKKGPWTHEEDQILINFIQNHGHSNWRALPKQAGLLRCGKSCRLRWINYLRPDIKRGNFSKEEEDTIIQLHEMMGNRWSAIAAKLQGRTDNEIKNVWNTHLKKRLPQYQNKTSTPMLSSESKHVTITKSTSTSGVSTSSDQVPSTSQQSYSSASFSSNNNNEVSSMKLANKMMNIVKNEPSVESQQSDLDYYPIIDESQQSDLDYNPIIDESFWSSDTISYDSDTPVMLYDTNNENNQIQQSLSESYNNFSSSYVENDQEQNGDSIHFWFDVFLKAGGETELPQF